MIAIDNTVSNTFFMRPNPPDLPVKIETFALGFMVSGPADCCPNPPDLPVKIETVVWSDMIISPYWSKSP